MSESTSYKTTTDVFRKSLADALYERITEGEAYMHFGDGGWDEAADRPKYPNTSQTALISLLLAKALQSVSKPSDFSVLVVGRLENADLVGEEISEAGLVVDGELLAIRNFSKKIKDADDYYDVSMTIQF